MSSKTLSIQRIASYLLGALYGHSGAGGYCHVAVDDGNLTDGTLWWCRQQAVEHPDYDCRGSQQITLLLVPVLRVLHHDLGGEDGLADWVETARTSPEYVRGEGDGGWAHLDGCITP